MSHLRKTLFHLCKTGLPSSKRGLFVQYNKKTITAPSMLASTKKVTGGRAAGARGQAAEGSLGVAAKFGQAAALFGKTIWNSNLVFKLMIAGVAVFTLLLIVCSSDKTRNRHVLSTLGETAVWGCATAFAVLLLCAGAEPLYAARPEAVFPIVFVVFLLLKRYRWYGLSS